MNKQIIQDFRMSPVENRPILLGDWVRDVFKELVKSSEYINKAFKESQKLCNRTIVITNNGTELVLCNDWFKQVLSQLTTRGDNRVISTFRKLKWDYNEAINPTAENQEIIEQFDFSVDIIGSDPVNITLVDDNKYPINTVLLSNASWSEWVIVGKSGNKYELLNDYGLSIFRSEIQLNRNYAVE